MRRHTSIGDFSFYECEHLETINLPASIQEIGEWAFYGCSGLTSLTVPESVTSIGEEAFHDCESLEISVYQGSYAETYCKENDLNYSYSAA